MVLSAECEVVREGATFQDDEGDPTNLQHTNLQGFRKAVGARTCSVGSVILV